MSIPTGDFHADPLDGGVHKAFSAWDVCHRQINRLRPRYDAALHLHETNGDPDPDELRTQLRATQQECDQLFFRFLRCAEDRTRAWYI